MSAPAGPAALVLARYAHGLDLARVPPAALEAAEQCLVDAVACAIFGSRFPWSRIVQEHALASGASGPCFLPGLGLAGLSAGQAALIGGSFAHAFELDSLRKPGAGVHPGATVAIPALAAAQQAGADGAGLLRAIVAGCEVMFRIGNATLHSAEGRGFHAPGVTGAFGSAVAAGLLLGLDPERLAAAMGIAGSLAGGLLAFAPAGEGGMVKRLHLGRAAESGIVAADLAARGFEGPASVLEGRYGVLEAFCPEADPGRLLAGLGTVWEIERLCLKPYACHVTAQAPVQFLRRAMAGHGFAAADIEGIDLGVSAKVLSHHANAAPRDVLGGQYSLPFALATAAHRDPADPLAFAGAPTDPAVLSLARRIRLAPADLGADKWGAEIAIRLSGGRSVSGRQTTFRGCPEDPFSPDDLERKFMALAGGGPGAARLLEELRGLRTRGLDRLAR